MAPNVNLDGVGKMSSLSRLDDNILLIHLAPLLGLDASLRLAGTNNYYRNLLLHHALGHNTIPSGHQLTTSFQPGAPAAISEIHIKPATSDWDVLSIMWGEKFISLKSLTISHTPYRSHNLLNARELGMRGLDTLTIECFTASELLTNQIAVGCLHCLRTLTIEQKCPDNHECAWPRREHILHALGPASKLTSLAISAGNAVYSNHYHNQVLDLLTTWSLPGSAPVNVSLVSLSFPIGQHPESDGHSLIVAARKSSLAHPKSPWRLGLLPNPNLNTTEKNLELPGILSAYKC